MKFYPSLLSRSFKNIYSHNLGRCGYEPTFAIQKRLVNDHLSSTSGRDIVLLVEHDPVYTIGLRDQTYSHEDQLRLEALGAEFYRADRGGLITFHGPGQLVVYPILNLKNPPFEPSIRRYVCLLENTIIKLCSSFYGVKAKRTEHTGIWVGNNKIAAIGVHNKRGVVSHGLALNCNVDLKWYDHIVPCGISDPTKWVTSLSRETRENVTVKQIIPQYLKCFEEVFQCSIIMMENL